MKCVKVDVQGNFSMLKPKKFNTGIFNYLSVIPNIYIYV